MRRSARRAAALAGACATGGGTFDERLLTSGWTTTAPGLRVFVIGDPADTAVPLSTQRAYFEALRGRGIQAYLATAEILSRLSGLSG